MSNEAPTDGQAPADWYPNPNGPGERYWDGNQWTEEVRTRGVETEEVRTTGELSAQREWARSKPVLIAVGAIVVGGLVVGLLLLTKVIGGNGHKQDLVADGRLALTEFEQAVANEDVASIQQLLAPGATYEYLADNPNPPINEYQALFHGRRLAAYTLEIISATPSDDNGADIQANYSYTAITSDNTFAGSGSLRFHLSKGPLGDDSTAPIDQRVRIERIHAEPDIYFYGVKFHHPPDTATYTVHLDSPRGPVVGEVEKTVSTKGTQDVGIPLKPEGRTLVGSKTKLFGVVKGNDATGSYRFKHDLFTPFAS